MADEQFYVHTVKGVPLSAEGIEQATHAGIQEGLKVAATMIRRVAIEDDDPGYIAFRDELAGMIENSIYQIAVIAMKRGDGDAHR